MANSDKVKQDAEMDMTPMIDCVFLLMIFFVLVIDLSQQDLEDLILPEAKFQEPDDSPPDVRPIANILQDGSIYYKANKRFDPNDPELGKEKYIAELLQEWRRNPELTVIPDPVSGVMLVDDPVLIRADKWTEWHYIGKFMTACSQPKAAFWKLELAMSEQDKEVKMLKEAAAAGK